MTSSPFGIAFDNSNNMWVVNQYYTKTTSGGPNYSLTKVAAQNYSTECTTPPCTAFASTANGTATTTTPSTADTGLTSFTPIPGTTGGLNDPFYVAIDGAGAAWVSNAAGAGLSAFNSSGGNISPSTGFSGGTTATNKRLYGTPKGIAIDGSGNIWEANTIAAYVTVVVGEATPTVTPLSLGIKNGTLASAP